MELTWQRAEADSKGMDLWQEFSNTYIMFPHYVGVAFNVISANYVIKGNKYQLTDYYN